MADMLNLTIADYRKYQSINQCLFFSATIFDFPRKEGFYSSHTGSITSLEISQHAQGSQIELHQVVWQAWNIYYNCRKHRDGATNAGSQFLKASNTHDLHRLNKKVDWEHSWVELPSPRRARWKMAPRQLQVRGEHWPDHHDGRLGDHYSWWCWWQQLNCRLWQKKWESQLQDNVSFSRSLVCVWHSFWGWMGWPSFSSCCPRPRAPYAWCQERRRRWNQCWGRSWFPSPGWSALGRSPSTWWPKRS